MGHHTEAYVGIVASESRNAFAIADGGRGGEVRYLGDFLAAQAAIRKLVAKLAAKYHDLMFCCADDPTSLHPQIFCRLFALVRNNIERDLGALA